MCNMMKTIKENNAIITDFKNIYYSFYHGAKGKKDSASFQTAVTCLAIFMLAFSFVLGIWGETVNAIIAYFVAILLAFVPVIIGAVKLYLLGEKRANDSNRIDALNKAFDKYLGTECNYSEKIHLIVALIDSYSKSLEGVLATTTKNVLFVLMQVISLLLALIPNFINWDEAGVNGIYVWVSINVVITVLSRCGVADHIVYNDLFMFISRDYRNYVDRGIIEDREIIKKE